MEKRAIERTTSPLEMTFVDRTLQELRPHQSEKVNEIYVRGQTRSVLYFKAPFTSRDGIHLGTIATLVDVTHRETEQPTGFWSHTQSGLPSIH